MREIAEALVCELRSKLRAAGVCGYTANALVLSGGGTIAVTTTFDAPKVNLRWYDDKPWVWSLCFRRYASPHATDDDTFNVMVDVELVDCNEILDAMVYHLLGTLPCDIIDMFRDRNYIIQPVPLSHRLLARQR